ncbi:hypothetical protein [Maribacter sp. R77961]|uniref:hypothetical protein n=1 Tax=Maribacter sp. R77961 TaxID=3093871 RepID=UPI0037CCBA0F
MRTNLILLLVICMGAFAQAQDTKAELKVNPISMPMYTTVHQTKLVKEQLPAVTGVFVLKHSRIKRALTFKIRKRDVKLV